MVGHYIPGCYLLAAPIRGGAGQSRAGQGMAVIFIIEHIKKLESF